jgi:hypothetical protein
MHHSWEFWSIFHKSSALYYLWIDGSPSSFPILTYPYTNRQTSPLLGAYCFLKYEYWSLHSKQRLIKEVSVCVKVKWENLSRVVLSEVNEDKCVFVFTLVLERDFHLYTSSSKGSSGPLLQRDIQPLSHENPITVVGIRRMCVHAPDITSRNQTCYFFLFWKQYVTHGRVQRLRTTLLNSWEGCKMCKGFKGRTVLFVCNGVDNRKFWTSSDEIQPKVLNFE